MSAPESPGKSFKGWAVPGPLPQVGSAARPELDEGETLDALSGHFRIFQLKKGHRFSTDDLLTAWYGTSWAPSVRSILDLGSGLGTVAMVAAWRHAGAKVTTIEAQEESHRLACKSIRLNGLSERFDARLGDFRAKGVLGPAERFDLVLGSPPYFPLGSGVPGDHPQKIACRFEVRGDISDYCRVAERHLEPGGLFACVFPVAPESQRERVRAGAREAGLSIVRWRPVIFREGEPPLLALFAMARATDLPEALRDRAWEEPALVIRRADGGTHPEYAAVKLSVGFPPT